MPLEIDYDSTLLECPAALVDHVLAALDLESWRIRPDDRLLRDSDVRNL